MLKGTSRGRYGWARPAALVGVAVLMVGVIVLTGPRWEFELVGPDEEVDGPWNW